VGTAGDGNLVLEVGVVGEQVPVVHAEVLQHLPELVEQAVLGLLVAGRVADLDLAVLVERDAVLGPRQVFGGEPEVDGVAGDLLQAPGRSEAGLAGLLAAEHRRLRLADHLDVAQRKLEVVPAAEVEVVDPEGLLEDGGVLFLRQREHGLAVVEHEVAPDLVGAVREPARVLVGRGREQQPGAVRGAAGDDHEVAVERLVLTVAPGHDPGHGRARLVALQLHRLGVGDQGDIRVLDRRPDGDHLGVRLGVHEAGEAVAVVAPDALAERHVGLVEQDAAGGVERAQAGLGEVVRQLLDPRLVADGRERVGRARGRFGRVLAARAVHLVELFGLRVVRLHLPVGDRPRRRDPAVVLELPEILLAQPVQSGAVALGRAADVVVHLRMEGRAVRVVPGVRRDVAVVHEHILGPPVLRLARQPTAALEQQDPLARWRQAVDERTAARAAADHDHVV
jgi:hypothetical protein